MAERIRRADVAQFLRQFKGGEFESRTPGDPKGFFQKLQKVFVQNNTGRDINVGDAMFIDGLMNDLAYDDLVDEYLTSGFCLSGVTYNADYPDRPVAFALEPIKQDDIGECRIDGLSPAVLTAYSDGTRYAKVDENTDLIAQGDASDYQIIGVSQENESGKRFSFIKPKAQALWNCWIRGYNLKAGVAYQLDLGNLSYSHPVLGGFTTEEAYNEFEQYGLVVGVKGLTGWENIPAVTPLDSLNIESEQHFGYARAYCDDRVIPCLVYVPPGLRNDTTFGGVRNYWPSAISQSIPTSERASLNDFKTVHIQVTDYDPDTLFKNGDISFDCTQYIVLASTQVETDTSSRFYGFAFCQLKPYRTQRLLRCPITGVTQSTITLQWQNDDLEYGNDFGIDSSYIGGIAILMRNNSDWRTESLGYWIISITPPANS